MRWAVPPKWAVSPQWHPLVLNDSIQIHLCVYMSQPTWVKSVRNVCGICVRWDEDYPCKHVNSIRWATSLRWLPIQVGWKSQLHACANIFGAETAYDLVIDNGRQLSFDVKRKISKWKWRNFLFSKPKEETIPPEWDGIHFMLTPVESISPEWDSSLRWASPPHVNRP